MSVEIHNVILTISAVIGVTAAVFAAGIGIALLMEKTWDAIDKWKG